MAKKQDDLLKLNLARKAKDKKTPAVASPITPTNNGAWIDSKR